MTISDAGLKFISENEGFQAHVYRDVAGYPTIGYGHKLLPNESFPDGVTERGALVLLRKDCDFIDAQMNLLMPGSGYLKPNQNQWDSLADFAYNLGVGSLRTMLSHGWSQIPEQILLWDHAGGKVVPGLLARRERELRLFQSA